MKRKCHFASFLDGFNRQGASALCFDLPHRIDMDRESWTTKREFVTCGKCLKKLDSVKKQFKETVTAISERGGFG